MKHYYLINNQIKASDSKMPDDENKIIRAFNIDLWKNRLQPCDIYESEYKKISDFLFVEKGLDIFNSSPIEITDIVDAEYDGHYENIFIQFKQPDLEQIKEVKSDESEEQLLFELIRSVLGTNFVSTPYRIKNTLEKFTIKRK